MTDFDDATATWNLLSEIERKMLAYIGQPYVITAQSAGRAAGISWQRAAHYARQLKVLGLVHIKVMPKMTSYTLTGQGEACLKAGKALLDSSKVTP